MFVACHWFVFMEIRLLLMRESILQLFLLFFVFSFYPVFSQESWTMDVCIAYALAHNLEQQNQTYNAAIEKEQWQQAKRDLIPQVYVGLPSYTINYGRSLDQLTNTFYDTKTVSGLNGGLSTSIVLFESFKRWNTLSYKKIQFESSKQTILQYKYDLAFRVMTLFNDVLFYQGNLEIVLDQQAMNKLSFKRITSEVKLGLKAKSDLYEIEATVSEDDFNVLQSKNRLKEAKLALLQEMNLEQDDIVLSAVLEEKTATFSEAPFVIETLFNKAQQSLPSFQIKKFRIESAEKYLAITRASLLPRLSLNAGINSGYSRNRVDALGNQIQFWEQLRANTNKYISLSLNIPIFNNGRNWSSTKIAKINLQKTKVQLKQETQTVYKEIQKLIQKNKALLAEKQLNVKKIKSKELAFTIAQKKYKRDLITLYEMQSASNAYTKAKMEQLQIKIQLSIQKKTLDFYNGTFILPISNTTAAHGY